MLWGLPEGPPAALAPGSRRGSEARLSKHSKSGHKRTRSGQSLLLLQAASEHTTAVALAGGPRAHGRRGVKVFILDPGAVLGHQSGGCHGNHKIAQEPWSRSLLICLDTRESRKASSRHKEEKKLANSTRERYSKRGWRQLKAAFLTLLAGALRSEAPLPWQWCRLQLLVWFCAKPLAGPGWHILCTTHTPRSFETTAATSMEFAPSHNSAREPGAFGCAPVRDCRNWGLSGSQVISQVSSLEPTTSHL